MVAAPFGAAPVVVTPAAVPPATPATLALLVAVALVCALATRRKPALAVCAFIVTGPFDFAHAFGPTTVTLPKAIVLGALAGLVLRGAGLRPLLVPRNRPLVAGAAAIVIATALSALPAVYIDATARETLKAGEYLALFACACVAFADDPDEDLLWLALGVVTVLVCSLALVQELTSAPSGIVLGGRIVPRIAGPLEGPNQLAGWCDLVVPMLAARALVGRRAPLFAALAVLAALTDALTLSRASYLALVPGLAIVAVGAERAGHRRRLTTAAVCCAAPLVALGAVFGVRGPRQALLEFLAWISPQTGENRLDNGLAPRSVLWHAALKLWASDPGLGVGAGNYELLTPLAGLVGVRTHANSGYLQALAEGGIPLFAATLWTLAAALRLLFTGRHGPLAVGVAAATVALAVHQGLDDLTFYPKVGGLWWTLLGVAAGTQAVARPRAASG